MLLLIPVWLTIVAFLLALSAVVLWGTARLLRVPHATVTQALGVKVLLLVPALLFMALGAAAGALLQAAPFGIAPDLGTSLGHLLALAGMLTVGTLLLRKSFRTTTGRALVILLLTLTMDGLLRATLQPAMRRFVGGIYVPDGNSMAPTLAGPHRQAPCPQCPGTLIVPPADTRGIPRTNGPGAEGICGACRQTSPAPDAPTRLHGPDRILVSPWHRPARWDIVVFRSPLPPESIYVKRVVGLPGETIALQDGTVWVQGRKLDLPSGLSGLRYDPPAGGGTPRHGSPEKPTVLGPDEYFVLGDASRTSVDSRFMGPIPGPLLKGVACARIWPPSRFQVFR